MRFGIFYEHQLPKPWNPGDEAKLFHDALEQVVLADRLGYDYAWEVEHHFLEEYSHSSAPEVFLAACATLTKNIRLGHGIRQVIPNYNHPARTAEGLGTLDIISRGRLDFGIGEGATRLELGGFGIPAKEKRALAIEAAEQIANMMVMAPYPGYEGRGFSFPCRNIVPKPVQSPHPPIWIGGVGRRRTLRMAAEHAAVWNAPGGSPAEVAELSAVLDGHCADIGRDPAEIRRSVQLRVPADVAGLVEQVAGFTAVGVTEIILIVAADPVAQAERVAALLPELRGLAPTSPS